MNKKLSILITIILSFSLIFIMSSVAEAAGNVSYEGQAEKFIFAPGSEYSPTDLFENFKNVMPGDTLTQKINVQNNSEVKVKIYMRSLGAHEDSVEFLSQMTLKVKAEGGTQLFNAPVNETAQLTDWIELGTFAPGSNIELNLTLNVPITMDNDFQFAIGYLDWQFAVEELPEPTTEEPTTEQPTSTSPGPGPKTGDENHMILWVILLIAALMALTSGVILIKTKKR